MASLASEHAHSNIVLIARKEFKREVHTACGPKHYPYP